MYSKKCLEHLLSKTFQNRFNLKIMELNNVHLDNLTLLNSLDTKSTKLMESKSSLQSCPSSAHDQSKIKMSTAKRKSPSHENVKKVFVQTFNPSLGKFEWEVQDEDYDFVQEVARSAYADMLHDDERNELYFAGLRDAVKILRARGDSVHVLDIGTGTGILSMMAVQCGADSVTSCEAFEPMADCAEKIIKVNNMESKIRVIRKRSTDLSVGPSLDLPQRANLLVAELFDTELIGEGAIGTYAHAREHLLTPDALLVPSSARVYAQVVHSPSLHAFSRPQSYHPPSLADIKLPESMVSCSGSLAVHDVQLSQLSSDLFVPISRPIEIFQFDWSGRKIPLIKTDSSFHHFKPLLDQSGSKSVIPTNKSDAARQSNISDHEQLEMVTCHVVVMWWDIIMDQSGEVILTCAPHWEHPNSSGPNSIPWRDHWMQAVYHLPSPLVQLPADSAFGEHQLLLSAARDDYSFWFSLSYDVGQTPLRPEAPHCTCGLHFVCPRTRLAQLADTRRLNAYLSAVSSVLSQKPGKAWLVLGDGVNLFIIGRLASDDRVTQVFVHERTQQGRRVLKEFIELNCLQARVRILPEDLTRMTVSDLKYEIGAVFSEPHFHTSLLPWYNIRANVLVAELSHLLPSLHFTPDSLDSSCDSRGFNFDSHLNRPDLISGCRDFKLYSKDSKSGSLGLLPDSRGLRLGSLQHNNCIDSTTTHMSLNEASVNEYDPLNPNINVNTSQKRQTAIALENHFKSIPTSALILPAQMLLYALPLSFINLWKIRAPCHQRCGFDLQIFDEIIDEARTMTDDYVEPQPLWEYPCYALHEPLKLLALDFHHDLKEVELQQEFATELNLKLLSQCVLATEDLRNSCFGSRTSRDRSEDTEALNQLHYNGVALWVDWVLGDQVVTTGPVEEVIVGQQVSWDMNSQQGVHLPRRSVPLFTTDEGAPKGGFQRCFFYTAYHLKEGSFTFTFDIKHIPPN